jgi:hypothetical protein
LKRKEAACFAVGSFLLADEEVFEAAHEFQGVTLGYRSTSCSRDLSFRSQEGEFFGIWVRIGSGKTTSCRDARIWREERDAFLFDGSERRMRFGIRSPACGDR